MNTGSDAVETLKEIMDREIQRHPHNRALLDAFRPLIIARGRMVESLRLGKAKPLIFDETRFRGGIPIIGQHPLFQADDPWEEIVRGVLPAVKEGFPELADDLGRLESVLREGKMILFDFFKAGPQEGEEIIAAWAEASSVPAPVIGFVLHQIARIVLEKRAKGLAELLNDIPWEKGYCPVCGTFPSLSVIKEKIGERLLHCSRCGHDWRFSRVICPYCAHEGQEGMNFFLVEDKAQESVYTCDRCQRYLITLSRMSDLNDRDLDVSAIGLVHLDMIMQEKNLDPMTVTGWNNF
ncbi:MAG: formate dehydrogenase accessory protein FdhE [Syntrophales bacterium]|nr:formate dehydrogenase accessory protein FdhE [Syntrophales bacterium]